MRVCRKIEIVFLIECCNWSAYSTYFSVWIATNWVYSSAIFETLNIFTRLTPDPLTRDNSEYDPTVRTEKPVSYLHVLFLVCIKVGWLIPLNSRRVHTFDIINKILQATIRLHCIIVRCFMETNLQASRSVCDRGHPDAVDRNNGDETRRYIHRS